MSRVIPEIDVVPRDQVVPDEATLEEGAKEGPALGAAGCENTGFFLGGPADFGRMTRILAPDEGTEADCACPEYPEGCTSQEGISIEFYAREAAWSITHLGFVIVPSSQHLLFFSWSVILIRA